MGGRGSANSHTSPCVFLELTSFVPFIFVLLAVTVFNLTIICMFFSPVAVNHLHSVVLLT